MDRRSFVHTLGAGVAGASAIAPAHAQNEESNASAPNKVRMRLGSQRSHHDTSGNVVSDMDASRSNDNERDQDATC